MIAKNSEYPAVSRKRSPREIRQRSLLPIKSHLPFGCCFGGALRRLLRGIDEVADTANRLDQLQWKAIVDLTAQVPDVDVDNIGQAIVVHVPDVFDDHGAAERTSAISHQIFEDSKLLGRELDGLA